MISRVSRLGSDYAELIHDKRLSEVWHIDTPAIPPRSITINHRAMKEFAAIHSTC
jgi:hypothetical protein